MNILSVRNLKKYYKMDNYTVKAVDNINLNINNHEFIAIVGSSGSGKSTFLKCIYRILKPSEGKILFNGKNIDELSFRQTAFLRPAVTGSQVYRPKAVPL